MCMCFVQTADVKVLAYVPLDAHGLYGAWFLCARPLFFERYRVANLMAAGVD